MFCACEVIQLFSIMFCMVTGVHKIDTGLVINDKKATSYSDRDSRF